MLFRDHKTWVVILGDDFALKRVLILIFLSPSSNGQKQHMHIISVFNNNLHKWLILCPDKTAYHFSLGRGLVSHVLQFAVDGANTTHLRFPGENKLIARFLKRLTWDWLGKWSGTAHVFCYKMAVGGEAMKSPFVLETAKTCKTAV